jgi:hypothetical protein
LFRGFHLDLDRFSQFTDQFCNQYVSNKSPGREVLSDDGRIQTVNLGHRHFPLHPEISREPWQPDVAWFACKKPADEGGETTICDGIEIAKAFSPALIAHLQQNHLAHTLATDLGWCSEFLRKADLTIEEIGRFSDPAVFMFTVANQQLLRTYLRPMLHKPMFSPEWAYGNFLVFARRRLKVKNFPVYANGREVSDQLVLEIESISNDLAYALRWQENDLLMLDNTRFMHGRNPIANPDSRRIYTQFGYLNFVPSDFPNLDKQVWRRPVT